MRRSQLLALTLPLLISLLVSVNGQQLIENCAVHYDVFDYYNPTVVRKICIKCQSTDTEFYVLRYDHQECIKTVNIVDGFQSCLQFTLDGKCKQTTSNKYIINDQYQIVANNQTLNYCAQVNKQGRCIQPVFPMAMQILPSSESYFQMRIQSQCAITDGTNCIRPHYGFIFITGEQNYFLFDFENYDKLQSTILSKLSDRLFCIAGYTFAESGCVKNGSPFPTIPDCIYQMSDYCYECAQGYALQNTRQKCQRMVEGCLQFENIRGVSICTKCDTSRYTLYRGTCSQNIAPVHKNVRQSQFCKAPYYSQHCLSVLSSPNPQCEIVDQQTGNCAQCKQVDLLFFDRQSNQCKSRVYSKNCAVKHPLSDSCYVPYCIPGYKFRYPLPSFYPPTFTYVDPKLEKDWRNQFLAAKPNVSQEECIINPNSSYDNNCQTFNATGTSCIQCKKDYWLTLKNDSIYDYYCSNDLTKFPDISLNCLEFNLTRTRCNICATGFQANSSGTCQKDNGSKCLTYSYNGYCSLCQEGYYPYKTGCSLEENCWLGITAGQTQLSCLECREDFNRILVRQNDSCQQKSSNRPYCTKMRDSSTCDECILGYVKNSNGYCERNYSVSTCCNDYVCDYTKPGVTGNIFIYRESNSLGAYCPNGYINNQCDICQGNCSDCVNDICYKCLDGYVLNSFKECVRQ